MKFKQIIDAARTTIRHRRGDPVALRRLLSAHSKLIRPLPDPPSSIDFYSVVPWHQWGEEVIRYGMRRGPGTLPGWGYSNGRYGFLLVNRREFFQFALSTSEQDFECDIRSVTGLSASKSNLLPFSCLYDFAEARCCGLIDDISLSRLRENLAHNEIRILHRQSTEDHFVRFLWTDRLFLMNSGGSHHFSAARYIANILGQAVPLRGLLRTYGINPNAVATLNNDFEIFAITKTDLAFNTAFHDALKVFRATYYWSPLPRPHEEDARAIFLPRQELRSASVASVLREVGVFDLGAHLSEMIVRQKIHREAAWRGG